MGRRSINTTKSGKYMNPTDQARKEARKQELKKNKKQRQMVRAAVLKGKDPQQILEEMEKIDQMEFNVDQPSPLNEKVLKEKRKKLKDTLDRVLGMYYKDDQDKWTELRKRQTEYEGKKAKLVAFFDSVKSAQSVTVDDIPLPQLPQQAAANAIPLPTLENKKPEVAIYSIATALKLQAFGQPIRDPPGCPPGPPPDLNDDGEVIEYAFKHAELLDEERIVEDTSLDGESLMAPDEQLASKPTSLQQKMVALSGQNVDEFIKEMETVQKKLDQRKEQDQAKLVSQMEQLLPPGTTDPVPTLPSMPPSNPPPIVPPPMIFAGPGIRLPPADLVFRQNYKEMLKEQYGDQISFDNEEDTHDGSFSTEDLRGEVLETQSNKMWTSEMTIFLIEEVDKFQKQFSEGVKKNVWIKVAQSCKTKNANITAKNCETKWKSLVRTYKGILSNNNTSGQKRRYWEFFDKIHQIMFKKPEIKAVATCSSLSGLKVQDEEGQENIVKNCPSESSNNISLEETEASGLEDGEKKNTVFESSFAKKRKQRLSEQERRHREKLQRLDRFNDLFERMVNNMPSNE